MKKNDQIIARVSEIYKWIEAQQLANKGIAGNATLAASAAILSNMTIACMLPRLRLFISSRNLAARI